MIKFDGIKRMLGSSKFWALSIGMGTAASVEVLGLLAALNIQCGAHCQTLVTNAAHGVAFVAAALAWKYAGATAEEDAAHKTTLPAPAGGNLAPPPAVDPTR